MRGGVGCVVCIVLDEVGSCTSYSVKKSMSLKMSSQIGTTASSPLIQVLRERVHTV